MLNAVKVIWNTVSFTAYSRCLECGFQSQGLLQILCPQGPDALATPLGIGSWTGRSSLNFTFVEFISRYIFKRLKPSSFFIFEKCTDLKSKGLTLNITTHTSLRVFILPELELCHFCDPQLYSRHKTTVGKRLMSFALFSSWSSALTRTCPSGDWQIVCGPWILVRKEGMRVGATEQDYFNKVCPWTCLESVVWFSAPQFLSWTPESSQGFQLNHAI